MKDQVELPGIAALRAAVEANRKHEQEKQNEKVKVRVSDHRR